MRNHFRPRLSLRWMLLLVAAVAVVLGACSYRIREQQQSVHRLQELGGQLDVPVMNVRSWITGIKVENVQFLGPRVGDESVTEIADASAMLNLRRITLVETRITYNGLHNLQSRLPAVQIKTVTPMQGLPGAPAQQLR